MALIVRITPYRVVGAIAALVVVGLLVAWSGVIHIGASTGHAAVTDWFLHWAMRNTVRTHAFLSVERPASDSTGLVSAAGHYASSCAPCHGAPGESASPQMQAATPHAPNLGQSVPTYADAELFWIVKHGIKLTGMPAWPAPERDDEIRRMTAFLRLLPRMSEDEYRELAYGPAGTIAGARPITFEAALAECERCHAEHGRGQPDIPILAGQKRAYLEATLEDFASGRRGSGVMQAAAARVGPELRQRLAAHYAAQAGLSEKPIVAPSMSREAGSTPRRAGSTPSEPASAGSRTVEPAGADELDDSGSPAAATAEPEAGTRASATGLVALRAAPAAVVARGIRQIALPACANCHAPGKREVYPILAGQKAEYLAGRLRGWRRHPHIIEARLPDEPMPMIARRIPEQLIEPLAEYFAAL